MTCLRSPRSQRVTALVYFLSSVLKKYFQNQITFDFWFQITFWNRQGKCYDDKCASMRKLRLREVSDTTIQPRKAETWGHTHPIPSGLWPSPPCSLPGMSTSNSNSWATYGFTRRMEGIPYSTSFWEEVQGHRSQSRTWAGTCGAHISLELLEKELARCPPAQKKTLFPLDKKSWFANTTYLEGVSYRFTGWK